MSTSYIPARAVSAGRDGEPLALSAPKLRRASGRALLSSDFQLVLKRFIDGFFFGVSLGLFFCFSFRFGRGGGWTAQIARDK